MSERSYDKPGTAQYGDEPAAEVAETTEDNAAPADAEAADEALDASEGAPV